MMSRGFISISLFIARIDPQTSDTIKVIGTLTKSTSSHSIIRDIRQSVIAVIILGFIMLALALIILEIALPLVYSGSVFREGIH